MADCLKYDLTQIESWRAPLQHGNMVRVKCRSCQITADAECTPMGTESECSIWRNLRLDRLWCTDLDEMIGHPSDVRAAPEKAVD